MSGNERTRRPTIEQVATAAGVDKAVVSKVLSGDAGLRVRPETRARVEAAIAEVGYVPNHLARGLRKKTSGTLGLTIPDFANPVYAEIIRGAEAEARRHGVYLLSTASGDRDDDPFSLLQEGRVDGLLIGDQAAVPVLPAQFRSRWVALNNRGTGCDRWIILDDQLGTRLAVNHLRQLGHTRIGYIAGPSGSDTASRRLEGYRSAMEELDLAVGAELIEAGGYQADAGAVAAQRLLDRDGPRPTAIVVANLVSAAGVLASVKGQGLSVPTDVSIVAIHDLPLAALLDPPLTTISMPLAALGRRGVARLLEPEEGPIRETISDEVVLVVRGSTTALT